MNEIAISTTSTIIGGETVNAVNARELWQFLEIETQFKDWISRRISDYGFEDGKDFCSFLSKTSGRPLKDYFISLDMAKELAMVENNAKGRAARQYFIEVEKRSRAAMMDPRMLADAMMKKTAEMLTETFREKARLEIENKLMRNYVPTGKPGELADNGKPKTNLRRAYWTSGTGKPASILLERIEQPGLFDEVHLQLQQAQG